jgi:hypothetical protein
MATYTVKLRKIIVVDAEVEAQDTKSVRAVVMPQIKELIANGQKVSETNMISAIWGKEDKAPLTCPNYYKPNKKEVS